MIRNILLGFVCSIAILSSLPVGATEPLAIKWNELVPEKIPDPFEKLSRKQLQDLAYVVRVHGLLVADKLKPNGPDAKEAAEIEQRLRKSGLDITYLLSLREQVRRLREMQAKSVQPDLEDKVVRLTGYVVPLKKSGDLVIEFLLVPNIDACSHATPPPPNQIVFVHCREGFANRGRQTAVRIIGRIKAKHTVQTIQRAGGPAQIAAAYAIAPTKIEVYRPNQ